MKHIKPFWFAWLPFLVLSALAAEKTLTLEEAVAVALKNNPDVLRLESGIDAARGRRIQSEAVPNPELMFSQEGLGDQNRGGEKEVSLGIRQVVEFPGKRALRRRVGEQGEEVSRLELERTKILVTSRVEKAYWQAVFAQEVVRSLETVIGILESYLELARERYRYGQADYLDVLRGQVESLKLRNERLEARRELRDRTTALGFLLGESGEADFVLTSGLAFVPLEKTLEQLLRELETRPTLRLAAAELRQTEFSLDLARRAAYPDFEITVFYPSLRTSAWGFEVGVQIPLGQKKRQGEVLETTAMSRQSQVSLGAQRSRLRLSLSRSYSDLKTAEEQLRLFEKGLLKDVEDAWSAALAQYQYGRTDSLSLLDIYRSYKETQREYWRTLLNYNLNLTEVKAAGEAAEE